MRALPLLLVVVAGCASGPEFDRVKPSTSRVPTASDAPYVARINEVGIRLLREAGASENFAISPIASGHNLAVLMNGSSGAARDELLTLFGLTESNLGAFNESQRALLNQLALGDASFVSGSAVFAVWPFRFDEGYVERMDGTYGAVVRKLGGATVEGKRLIHVWVEERIGHDYLAPEIELTKQLQIVSMNCSGYYWNLRKPQEPIVSEFEFDTHRAYSIDLHDGFELVALVPREEVSLAGLLEGLEATSFVLAGDGRLLESATVPEISISVQTDLVPLMNAIGVSAVTAPDANLRHMSVELESGYSVSRVISRTEVHVRSTPRSEKVIVGPYLFAVVEKKSGALCILGVSKG